MARCVLIVDFRLKPGAAPAFHELLVDHATRTLAEEPGCRAFDVLRPELADGRPDDNRAILYEAYDDRDAYEAHRRNPRMAHVNAAIEPLIESRDRMICVG